MVFASFVPISRRTLKMSKCKHGFKDCSECGTEKERGDNPLEDVTETFNNFCAEVLGYRPSYRHRVHLWLNGEEEIIKSNFNPRNNLEQLIPVVEQLMKEKISCQE